MESESVKALENGKGIEIAKQNIASRLEAQKAVLQLLGLRLDKTFPNIITSSLSKTSLLFMSFEVGVATEYFQKLNRFIPSKIKFVERRQKSYDLGNNAFSLGFSVLENEVLKALLKSSLDVTIGFIHRPTRQTTKLNLVYDIRVLSPFNRTVHPQFSTNN